MRAAGKIKSFTLLELVIVVIIVAVLAGLGIPLYQKSIWRARYTEVYNTIGTIARAKELYYAQYGNWGGSSYTLAQCSAGHGYGETQVQRDLGITIDSNSFWHYGIYPWSSDSSTYIYFQQESYGSWIGYYNYVTHTWGNYSLGSSPAGQYYVRPQ